MYSVCVQSILWVHLHVLGICLSASDLSIESKTTADLSVLFLYCKQTCYLSCWCKITCINTKTKNVLMKWNAWPGCSWHWISRHIEVCLVVFVFTVTTVNHFQSVLHLRKNNDNCFVELLHFAGLSISKSQASVSKN